MVTELLIHCCTVLNNLENIVTSTIRDGRCPFQSSAGVGIVVTSKFCGLLGAAEIGKSVNEIFAFQTVALSINYMLICIHILFGPLSILERLPV